MRRLFPHCIHVQWLLDLANTAPRCTHEVSRRQRLARTSSANVHNSARAKLSAVSADFKCTTLGHIVGERWRYVVTLSISVLLPTLDCIWWSIMLRMVYFKLLGLLHGNLVGCCKTELLCTLHVAFLSKLSILYNICCVGPHNCGVYQGLKWLLVLSRLLMRSRGVHLSLRIPCAMATSATSRVAQKTSKHTLRTE